jgi:hypothetical protein
MRLRRQRAHAKEASPWRKIGPIELWHNTILTNPMKTLKHIFAVLLFVALAFGQGSSPSTTGAISASGATCATTNACIGLILQNTAAASTSSVVITLVGGFTGTIQFEASADGGNTFVSVPGTPAAGGTAVTSATAAGVWNFSLPAYTNVRARASAFASGPLTVTIQASTASVSTGPAGNISGLAGTLAGQPSVGGPSGGLVNDPTRVSVLGYKTGSGLNSPCAAIQSAVAGVGTMGNIIDAGGLANASNSFSGLGFTNTTCGLDSNIFGGTSGGQAAITALNAGEIDLGPMNLIVSQVPAQYGVCCQVGSTLQTPPTATMYIGNGVNGLKGRGRGYAGTKNTTITVASAAGNGGLNPQTRSWAIPSAGIVASNIAVTNQRTGAGFREYLTISPTANSWSINSITASGNLATVTQNQLISGQLSAGQFVTISGNATFNNQVMVCGNNAGFPVTQVSVVGGTTTYAGTFPNGAANGLAGLSFTLSGFVASAGVNNITFTALTSSAIALTVATTVQINETHTAAATPNICPVAGPVTIGGVTQWTFPTLTSGTLAGGSLAVGMNFVPGEYVQIEGATGAPVDDNRYRVCAPQAFIGNGVGGDNNCTPPTNASIMVVGIHTSTSTNMHGATSINCAANCGTLVGVLPVIDIGDPTKANSQFAELIDHILIDCNNVPSCVGIRDLSGNEQSGVQYTGVTGTQEACYIISSNVGQNSYGWFSLECLPDAGQSCFPGTTGYIMSDNGARILNGWTYVAPSCGAGVTPITGFYNDVNGTSVIGTGHSEKVIFGMIAGANAPSNGWIATGIGGMPANPGNVTDGPYTGNPPAGAAAHAISGAFPSQINGANSAFTGDYCFLDERKSSNVSASFFTDADDYFGYTSSDPNIMLNCVDTFGNATFPVHVISSASVPTVYQSIGTASVCGAADTGTPPAGVVACLAASSGAFTAKATDTSVVVSTTAVTATSKIFLQAITDNTGIAGAPACVAPTLTTDPVVSARSAGVSFTFTLTSSGITCWNYWIVN